MNAILRREKHKEQLRRAILDAARELFVREGYDGFSMRKLATEIGYSPGSLYLHFENKQALFGHLLGESFQRLHRHLTEHLDEAGEDPVTVLMRGLHRYVEFGLANPDDYRLAFLAPRPLFDGRYTVYSPFDVLRDHVRRCIAAGALKTRDAETTSQALWAAVHGVTALLIQRPQFPWVERQQLMDQVIGNAVTSLRV